MNSVVYRRLSPFIGGKHNTLIYILRVFAICSPVGFKQILLTVLSFVLVICCCDTVADAVSPLRNPVNPDAPSDVETDIDRCQATQCNGPANAFQQTLT